MGTDNDLALAIGLARLQTIIWTNDGEFIEAYMHHSASII